MMQKMQFPTKLLIHDLLLLSSSEWFSNLNFTPFWEIQQGDPLSPYLFILCSEGFFALLRSAEENGDLKGFNFGRSATISHLLFADDSLLFAKENIFQAATLRNFFFLIYEDCSGQTINYDKSGLFFSKGASDSICQDICSFLRIPEGWGNKKYLGLLFMTERLKKDIFYYHYGPV